MAYAVSGPNGINMRSASTYAFSPVISYYITPNSVTAGLANGSSVSYLGQFAYNNNELTGGYFNAISNYSFGTLNWAISSTYVTLDTYAYYEYFNDGLGLASYIFQSDDIVIGAEFAPDILNGFDGNDVLIALGGNDVVYGGIGADWLWGGSGLDTLYGETGNDVLVGDTYLTETGADWLDGGTGNDILIGGNGVDSLVGGDGDDWLFGSDGSDSIVCGAGNDAVYGDLFANEAGNDFIEGGYGADTLIGGTGDDIIYGGNFSGPDDSAADWLYGFEGNDTLYGNGGDDVLYGDGFSGESGADQLFGGAGSDTLFGGVGSDVLDGGAGRDQLDGGAGQDRFVWTTRFDAQLGDVVSNFTAGIGGDIIDLRGLGFGGMSFATFSSAAVREAGGVTYVDLDPGFQQMEIALPGVVQASLGASNFLL